MPPPKHPTFSCRIFIGALRIPLAIMVPDIESVNSMERMSTDTLAAASEGGVRRTAQDGRGVRQRLAYLRGRRRA